MRVHGKRGPSRTQTSPSSFHQSRTGFVNLIYLGSKQDFPHSLLSFVLGV